MISDGTMIHGFLAEIQMEILVSIKGRNPLELDVAYSKSVLNSGEIL